MNSIYLTNVAYKMIIFMSYLVSIKGPYTNYVDMILEIFDPPSPLRRQVYYISLCSSIYIWQTPPPSSLVYVVCVWPLKESQHKEIVL